MPHRPLQTAFTRATGRGRSPHARLREDYPRQSGSEPLPDAVEDEVELELGVAFHLSELAVQLDDAGNLFRGEGSRAGTGSGELHGEASELGHREPCV